MFIRSEEGISRDVVKHLNQIEEQVLESRAWSRDSALWAALQAAEGQVPTVEEVSSRLEPTGPPRASDMLLAGENYPCGKKHGARLDLRLVGVGMMEVS